MKEELLTDPDYLKKQYADSRNLRTRQVLHEKYSTCKERWHPWVFDQLELAAGESVLELGCGQGNLWFENANRIPQGLHLYMTDLSAGMLKKSRQNLEKNSVKSDYGLVDALNIPFAANSLDCVVANHMLYHIADIQNALLEIRRVLKPGGRFLAATNGDEHMLEFWQLLKTFYPQADGRLTVGRFTLQNGPEKLSEVFSLSSVSWFKNSLEVKETEPLIQYILSTRFGDTVRPVIGEISAVVGEKIKQEGYFGIRIQSGVIKTFK